MEIIEETREEKVRISSKSIKILIKCNFQMYRNWMNSLGVNPHVNYLYSDLYDGLVIFQVIIINISFNADLLNFPSQLMDFIQPGIVNWKRVKTAEQQSKIQAKRFQEVLGNCNYAVELGRKLNFVLVGIGGLFSI